MSFSRFKIKQIFMAFSIYNFYYETKKSFSARLSNFWQYKANRYYFLLNLLLFALLSTGAFLIYKAMKNEFFIFQYNVDFGISGVASALKVFRVPILIFILLVFNFILSLIFNGSKHYHLLAHAFGLTSLSVNIIAILSIASLYLINFIA